MFSTHVILVHHLALLCVAVGALMVFRQASVRRWWRAFRPRTGPRRTGGEAEDPARYALIIFGMMLLAFGLILFGFTTLYAFFTAP